MFLLESIGLMLIGLTISITILRRGKNYFLKTLSIFFITAGFFYLIKYLPASKQYLIKMPNFTNYLTILFDILIFLEIISYCLSYLSSFKKKKIFKIIYVTVLFVIFSFTIINSYLFYYTYTELSPKIIIQILNLLTNSLLIISFFLMALVFLCFIKQLREDKGVMDYATTTRIGLGLMFICLLIIKLFNLAIFPLSISFSYFISLIALGSIIAGAILQTSFSMSPGFVYNAKTKKPIPLAIVRLFRAEDNKLIENKNTQTDGHYSIMADQGKYKLIVEAHGYKFPAKNGIYQGGNFKINKTTILSIDIALDPET